MISRIWHGWTTPENADVYERLLKAEVFVGIAERQMPGYRGIQLLRRDAGDEVELVTEMWFDSLDAVCAFVGEDCEVRCGATQSAHSALPHFDARSQHYVVEVERVPRRSVGAIGIPPTGAERTSRPG